MSFAAGNGPARGGWSYPPVTTTNIMRDPRPQLTLQEGLACGVGKAHRQVNFAHFEFRNYRRDALAKTGKIGP